MARFFDKFGNLALLHWGQTGVLAGKNLAGVSGVFGQCLLVENIVILRIFTFRGGSFLCCHFTKIKMLVKNLQHQSSLFKLPGW